MQLARSLSTDSATPLGVEFKLPGIRFKFTIKRYMSCLVLVVAHQPADGVCFTNQYTPAR